MADNTARKQPAHLRDELKFQPGQSGNPKGRPKGSRSKLSEAFIADMCASWEEHGREVIDRVREDSPDVYLRVVASLLPRELNVTTNPLDGMSDAELAERIRILDEHIRATQGDTDEPATTH